MNVRDDTAAGDSRLDKGIELLVATDGELKMARGDALHLEILARVTGKLEHLGGEVLEDGRRVDSRGSTHALLYETKRTRDTGDAICEATKQNSAKEEKEKATYKRNNLPARW